MFAPILPLLVYLLQHRASITPAQTALYTAKTSIIFMGTGALIIGLAESDSALIPGLSRLASNQLVIISDITNRKHVALIINTLGLGTDLALLIFLANLVKDELAGRVIMLTASLESAGSLAGI
jgi:hypothetical protein